MKRKCEPKCTKCGRIESNACHVKWVNDLDNPVKHCFVAPERQPREDHMPSDEAVKAAREWMDTTVIGETATELSLADLLDNMMARAIAKERDKRKLLGWERTRGK